MSVRLDATTFAAGDPQAQADFWAALLGWEQVADPRDGSTLEPHDDTGFRVRFEPSADPKVVQNRMHFDLTSATPEQQEQTVAHALDLGGRHVDVGQRPEETHVVLGDPEGNEFCVIAAGNAFLAGCGFLGAVACDGSDRLGYFMAEALGWPLVWDQDQETAIRSPHGGPKLTWGGPPLPPKPGRNRVRFDVAAEGDLDAEVERLLGLGATRSDVLTPGSVELLDPDGNELRVWPASR